MSEPRLNNHGFTADANGDGEWIAQQALSELARWDSPLVFVLDQNSRRFLYLDGPCERLLGLTREQIIGDADAWQRVLDNEGRAIAVTLRRDLELHAQVMRVLRVVHPDGRQRTLRATAAVRKILGRSIVSGSVRELGLRNDPLEDAGHFRLAVESTHEGVAVTDPAGCFVFLNRMHASMFGYGRAEELIGQSWRVLYDAATALYIEEKVFPELMSKGVWRGRVLAKRKDSSVFHEAVTLSLLPNGGIVCNCRDASEEVEMEARLEASEAMFRTFLNTLAVGVAIKNRAGNLEFLNRATEDFIRLEVGDGTSPDVILSTSPHFSSWRAADEQVATTGEVVSFDFPIQWAGQDRVLDVRKLPLRIGLSDISYICTLFEDVTELRKMTAAADAIAKQREAYRLMQREFIAMVSHEFRTPLTSIRGVHYLLTNKAEQLPSELALGYGRLLGMQNSAISTLTELVDQVLLLNRIEHMSLEVAPQKTLLAEFIRRIIGNIDNTLDNGRLRLELDVPEDSAAMLDEPQMRALLENLVSNGLKYAPESTQVRVAVKAELAGWELTVADSGRGIPPEDQANLFRPFHRASNVGQVPGTGLGLTIIRRVVDYHRAKVEVDSEVGRGTTFKVFFPWNFSMTDAGPTDAAPRPTHTALPFSRSRFL